MMIPQLKSSALSRKIIPRLHKFSVLRRLAKRTMRGVTIRQAFHGGVICCDAVDHSWAWVKGTRYEEFDRELQELLLRLSQEYDLLIDVGCNIGAMTLSCLLRNTRIRSICIDPNRRAIRLLARSLDVNNLAGRADLIEAAMANDDGQIKFNEEGSVIGHVSDKGHEVRCLSFRKFLNGQLESNSCLVKVDVEGFEVNLLQRINDISGLRRMRLVVELHPEGWNGIGNPKLCMEYLHASGATILDLYGTAIKEVDSKKFSQVCANW
jgi:FkbM family methyltransferase